MLKLSVDMNRVIEQVSELALISSQIPGAIEAAVEDTREQAEEYVTDAIHRQIAAERPVIRSRVGSTETKRKTRLVLSSTVYVSPRPIALNQFPRKQTGAGVLVSVFRRGGGRVYRNAFGPDIPRLGRGVFRRKGKSRTPIKRVPGFVLANNRAIEAAVRSAQPATEQFLQKRIDYHIARMLRATTSGRTIYRRVYVQQVDAESGVRSVGF